MNGLKVAAQVTFRRAADLTPGDRIAGDFLPAVRDSADVEFVGDYQLRERWVMVVFRLDDGRLYSECFLADAEIPLERTADDLGQGYSREAEDPRPVSPARVQPHSGILDGTARPSTVHPREGDEFIVDGLS